MKKGWFFGVPILLGKRAELQRAAETCLSHHGILHTVNPLMLSYALTNVSFRRVLRDGVNMPDGVGIKLSFLLKGEKTDVYPGIDLCETLFAKAKSVVFYGAEKGVAQRAFEALAKKHQNAPTACFFDGFETKREEVEAALQRQKPDLVFVALGTPRQEKEMQKLYDDTLSPFTWASAVRLTFGQAIGKEPRGRFAHAVWNGSIAWAKSRKDSKICRAFCSFPPLPSWAFFAVFGEGGKAKLSPYL